MHTLYNEFPKKGKKETYGEVSEIVHFLFTHRKRCVIVLQSVQNDQLEIFRKLMKQRKMGESDIFFGGLFLEAKEQTIKTKVVVKKNTLYKRQGN